MTCGDGRLQRGLRCKNQDVMLLEPSICSSQPSTRAAKPHCDMRTVPAGMGGTELASFSSLVIQQPLEGARALPLAQDVEIPDSSHRLDQGACLAWTLFHRNKVCVPAGKAGLRHLTAHIDPRATSTFKPSTHFSGDLKHVTKSSTERDPFLAM